MKRWKTNSGTTIIRVLSRRSNAYLILTNSHVFLVDTGKESSYRTLIENIESLNKSISDISFLILTHTHYDHCQSAVRIKEESGCQIIVSGKATDSIKIGYSELPAGTTFFSRPVVWLGRKIGNKKFGFEPFQPDILVGKEYQMNASGSNIKIIETPGHSIDSVSIIVDNEVAIAGDAMFGVFRKSVFPPFADDVGKMVESWGRLLKTGCSVFLPGHGNEVKRNRLQREYEKYDFSCMG